MKELSLEEAALAWAQGKRVEARPVFPGGAPWSQIAPLGTVQNQMWPASIFNDTANSRSFRLAPEPPAKKFRPWAPEEVPVGAQAKTKVCDSEIQMIVGRNLLGVLLAQDSGAYPFRDMLELRLHSIDGGKTWMPCGVEVDA